MFSILLTFYVTSYLSRGLDFLKAGTRSHSCARRCASRYSSGLLAITVHTRCVPLHSDTAYKGGHPLHPANDALISVSRPHGELDRSVSIDKENKPVELKFRVPNSTGLLPQRHWARALTPGGSARMQVLSSSKAARPRQAQV